MSEEQTVTYELDGEIALVGLNRPDKQAFQILARLKPTTVLPEAQAQADLLMRQFDTTYVERAGTTEREQARILTLQRPTLYPNADGVEFQAAWGAVMLIVGLVLFVTAAWVTSDAVTVALPAVLSVTALAKVWPRSRDTAIRTLIDWPLKTAQAA